MANLFNEKDQYNSTIIYELAGKHQLKTREFGPSEVGKKCLIITNSFNTRSAMFKLKDLNGPRCQCFYSTL